MKNFGKGWSPIYNKPLSEMTLQELWVLFPVILKEHNPQYKLWYEAEKQSIQQSVSAETIIRINHIGSSAVENLISKPTVDILLEISGCCDVIKLTRELTAAGWSLMRKENEPVAQWAFNKGYTPRGFGEKVFHLHIRYWGDWSELYFRDYLMAHPEIAREYGKLKTSLLKDYQHDRDGYTLAKTEFVLEHSKMAKEEFPGKYKPKVS